MRLDLLLKIIYRDTEWDVRAGMTVRDAIIKVGLEPDEMLAIRNGELINEETLLAEHDVVKLIGVISGGTR